METTTVRLPKKVHQTLKEISRKEGISLQEATTKAIEYYERQKLLDEANEAYAKLRNDPAASKAYDEELATWEALTDGLEDY